MTTRSAITAINEVLPVLNPDSDLAQALHVALSALRELHRAELAGQQKKIVLQAPRSYPVTVVKDRFGGVYSGGAYTAWNLEPWELPNEIAGGDMICCDFWADNRNRQICGKGATPDEAERDLIYGPSTQ